MSVVETLGKPLAALAFCWRMERRDGVTIGLTSHDRDLAVGGLTYRATPGLTPAAVRGDASLEPDGTEVSGQIASGAIEARDLEAGRWDGAAVALYLTEWDAPGALWLMLAAGTLGAVERKGGAFTAELKGPAAALDAPVAPATTPHCRAMLGDRACRVDLAGRRRLVSVAGVDEDGVAAIGGGGLIDGDFAFGSLRWLDGENAGLVQAIIANGAGSVSLTDAPAFAVEAGTRAMLTEGCDKRLDTCRARFANAVNFRGEPYLPGNDLLMRYPGG